ncbi:MAG TPA: hypothetical protein VN181_05895, partial [Thermoanaerobaculia bacterium]|nr:hypothetical protein [Thermoanaerobaculia bacterium]
MRRLTISILSLCLASVAFADEPSSAEVFAREHSGRFAAARHMILDPQHALAESDRAALEQLGVTIQRPLTNGRLLVRVAPDSTFDAGDPRVRSLEPLQLGQKIHRTAWREAATMESTGEFHVWFHDDVSFAAATEAIEAAGGVIDQPLQVDFDIPRSLSVRLPV